VFRSAKSIFFYVGNEIFVLVDQEPSHADQAGNTNGNEAQPRFAKIETIYGRIDQWESFEEGIINSIGKRRLSAGQ